MGYTRGRVSRHCPFCGTRHADDAGWPRDCAACGETSWHNPLPVAVALQPAVGPDGQLSLVVVRRNVEPGRGKLAFPGGYIEVGESWQEAAVRELREETHLVAAARDVELFDVRTAVGTIDIFALLPACDAKTMPAPMPTPETIEWFLVSEPVPLAFPAHTKAMEAFFASPASP
ncbi:NUDIX domain-containing protein [Kitasatospora acidiphila]|uniref:NUDIX domain-containing protein n=1 Tax=Kitasatospora acidiphila TaxID=2567942 RepID=A0A540VYX9_9ACTN|nr:NUDIX domain-containing protein [Kitasatospora acidiphila]TQF01960.1 NUDIX domain-containing protein [Kitasatospora acidiphila]